MSAQIPPPRGGRCITPRRHVAAVPVRLQVDSLEASRVKRADGLEDTRPAEATSHQGRSGQAGDGHVPQPGPRRPARPPAAAPDARRSRASPAASARHSSQDPDLTTASAPARRPRRLTAVIGGLLAARKAGAEPEASKSRRRLGGRRPGSVRIHTFADAHPCCPVALTCRDEDTTRRWRPLELGGCSVRVAESRSGAVDRDRVGRRYRPHM